MDQLSRTSLFSELSDLSVTGVDDGDQCKDPEANSTPKMVCESSVSCFTLLFLYCWSHKTCFLKVTAYVTPLFDLKANAFESKHCLGVHCKKFEIISFSLISFSSQVNVGLRTVASLHGSPKPLQASSSMGLGQSSNKRQRPYSSISDDESEDSDLEYDEDEIVIGRVTRDSDFYAQLEKEEKANAQVGR